MIRAVTRILVLDDQPVIRAGLAAVLRAEPGLVPVAATAPDNDVLAVIRRTRPHIVLLNVHLPAIDELVLTRRIKRQANAPAVVLYAREPDETLHVAASLAGADGVVSRQEGAEALFDAIRMAARGEVSPPPVSPAVRAEVIARLEESDLPIFSMLLDATPPAEVAPLVGLTPPELSRRIEAMLSRLTVAA
jgi:DNA-binding NarL/FixJ family response regulator